MGAPQKYGDLYPAESITLPLNYSAPVNAPRASLHNGGEFRNYRDVAYADAEKSRVTDDYARNLIRGYYASVSYADPQIERIVTKLKTNYDRDDVALYDKTIIVLWGTTVGIWANTPFGPNMPSTTPRPRFRLSCAIPICGGNSRLVTHRIRRPLPHSM